MSGSTASLVGTTAFATRETGEPPVPGDTIGHTVWWSWTAPTNGQLRLAIPQDGNNTAVAVFTGNTLGELQLVSSNVLRRTIWGDLGSRMSETLLTDVDAGLVYQIAVDWNRHLPAFDDITQLWVVVGTDENGEPIYGPPPLPEAPAETGAPVAIDLQFAAAPTNDAFSAPAVLVGKKATVVAASTVGARVEAGEPTNATHSVWWTWTAPRSGLAALSFSDLPEKAVPTATTQVERWPEPTYNDPNGVSSNKVLWCRLPIGADPTSYEGWSGDVVGSGSLTTSADFTINLSVNYSVFEAEAPPVFVPILTAYRGDSLATLQLLGSTAEGGVIQFRAIKGETYRFCLGSQTETGGEASFNLVLTTPENDDFADRFPLSGVDATATGHTVGATRETGERVTDGYGPSAWWTYTPNAHGNLTLALRATSHQIKVFRGSVWENLELLGSSTSDLTVPAKAGEPLQISVEAYDETSENDYSIGLHLEPLPPAIAPGKGRRWTDGSFQVQIDQIRGRKITVSASTNLVDWEPLWTGVVNAESVGLRDFGAMERGSVFYRVQLAP